MERKVLQEQANHFLNECFGERVGSVSELSLRGPG